MEHAIHPFSELFAQLGLPDDHASIQQFIATHSPLPDGMRLEEARSGRLPRPSCCAKNASTTPTGPWWWTA